MLITDPLWGCLSSSGIPAGPNVGNGIYYIIIHIHSFWLSGLDFLAFLSIRWKRHHPGTVAWLLRDSNSFVSSPNGINIHNSASQWRVITSCSNCKATVRFSILQEHREMGLLCKKTPTNQTQTTGYPKTTTKSIIHEFRRKENTKVLTILFRVLRWES